MAEGCSASSDSSEAANSSDCDTVVTPVGVVSEGVGDGPEARLGEEPEEIVQLELVDVTVAVGVNLQEGLMGFRVADVVRNAAHPEELIEEVMELAKIERSLAVIVIAEEYLVDVLVKLDVADVHVCCE